MKLPVIGTIDERFLMHRLRSTSIAGLAAVLVTGGLFFRALWATTMSCRHCDNRGDSLPFGSSRVAGADP